MVNKKILLAITGATGMLYVVEFLRLLSREKVEIDAVISDAGRQVLWLEKDLDTKELPGVSTWYDIVDFTAPPASGSSRYEAMIILPCTMGTLAAIAGGFSGNLIHRAADVTLKERRPLLLAVREMPFNRTHLRNMLIVHDAGATVCPPIPSFYHKPRSLEEMARNYSGRLCDLLGIETEGLKRWQGVADD